MSNYITVREIEELIKKLPLLEALLKNLQVEVKRIYSLGESKFIDESEILYALSIGNRAMSDMPRSTNTVPGDKETKIIDRNVSNKAYTNTLKELVKEVAIIGEVVEKLNNSLGGLTENQQYILKEFHKEGTSRKTWKQIASHLNISPSLTREERTNALKRVSKILRVDKASYDFCMRELEMLQTFEAEPGEITKKDK